MVVLLGDLARERVGDDLGDVLAAMIDHYRQGYALAGVDFEPLRLAIAHMDIDADRRAATACILDPEAQRLLLADDAEARRLLKHDAAIDLAAAARQEGMDRCVEAKLLGVWGHVMDFAVGDEDGTRETLRRHFGKRLPQGREEARAILARGDTRTGGHHLELEISETGRCGFKRCKCGIGLGVTVAEVLTLALIDNGDRDIA